MTPTWDVKEEDGVLTFRVFPEIVNYDVTVFVPNPAVEGSWDRVVEIADGRTVTPSYDDAGRLCNALGPGDDGGLAVLFDIPEEKHSNFIAYFAELYPMARIEFRDSQPVSGWEKYLLAQGDPRWGDYQYADGQCYPLRSQGCFITACAMAQNILGLRENATPVTVDKEIGPAGYDHCLLLHSAMRETLDLDILWANEKGGIAHVEDGGIVFIEVKPTSLQHFVVGVEYRDGDFLVLDPWKNTFGALKDLYPEGVESVRLIKAMSEDNEPEPLERTGLIAMHAQWNRGIAETVGDFGAIKVVEDFGMIDHFPEGPFILVRNWLGRDETERYTQMGPEAHFDEQLRPLLDKYPQINAIEDGMNEEAAPHQDGKNEWCAWWALSTERLVREYTNGRVKTVMVNAGPGAWPLEGEGIRFYKHVFKVSHQYGNYIGVHNYTPAIGDMTWINKWYCHRFMKIDEYAGRFGYHPLYLGTECGPCGGVVEYVGDTPIPHLNAGAGWRTDICLNGDWTRHQQVMRGTCWPIVEWNKTHANRFRWMFAFTVGPWNGWNYDPGNIEGVLGLNKEFRA